MNLWIVMCAAQISGKRTSTYIPSEAWFTDSAEDAEEYARKLIRAGRQYVTIHTAMPIPAEDQK